MSKIVSATVTPSRGWGDQARVEAEFEDGTKKTLFRFYDDELSFTADEFIGKTEAEAKDLFCKKDAAYLRS